MDGLKPPRSENEDLHRKILERLSSMTDEEFRESAVRAGIRTADGELEEAYKNASVENPVKGSLGEHQ